MEIPLNVRVQCSDQDAGRTICVILDPLKDQVTHLVVSEGGIFSTERLVPVGLILETTHDSIKLKCTMAELREMESFTETEFIPSANEGTFMWPYYSTMDPGVVAIEHERIPKDELAIRRGDAVYASDGHIGRVDEFLIEPASDCVTHLVMREGHLWGRRDVTIPVSQIERFENDTVYLKLTKAQVSELPTVPVKRKG
jgi:uncharacterized protein YrrD